MKNARISGRLILFLNTSSEPGLLGFLFAGNDAEALEIHHFVILTQKKPTSTSESDFSLHPLKRRRTSIHTMRGHGFQNPLLHSGPGFCIQLDLQNITVELGLPMP